MRIHVLGVGFDNLTMDEAVEQGISLLQSPGAHYAVTPNPEIVEICRENLAARQAVNRADLVLPDGIGIIKGARMLGTPLKSRVPGIEFAAQLMEQMARQGLSLYLLGAKPGVAEAAGKKLAEKYPGLKISGTHDGYFEKAARTACLSALAHQSRNFGWQNTARLPAPIFSAAWAEAWIFLPE